MPLIRCLHPNYSDKCGQPICRYHWGSIVEVYFPCHNTRTSRGRAVDFDSSRRAFVHGVDFWNGELTVHYLMMSSNLSFTYEPDDPSNFFLTPNQLDRQRVVPVKHCMLISRVRWPEYADVNPAAAVVMREMEANPTVVHSTHEVPNRNLHLYRPRY